jgi:peptidyl-prolyl cis-trans isomerase C
MKIKFSQRHCALLLVSLATPFGCFCVNAAPVAPAPPTGSTLPKPPGAAVAEVNGEKILAVDIDRLMKMIREREPAFDSGTPEAQKSLADLRNTMIENKIVERLLSQEARRLGIVPAKAEVDKGVEAFKDGDTDEEFKKRLAAEGKTPDDVRRTISDELARRELAARLTADISVTNADVAAFYKANPDQFKVPEMVRARHILVAYPDKATAAQKQAARTKAEDLLKKAKAKPADFPKLARENTADLGTKDVGGDLDFATRGTFLESFENVIFAAPVGLIPKLVETEYGLHVVKIEEKQPARTLKLDEIVNDADLRQEIRQEKVRKRIDESIAALRAKAKITKY